MVESMKRIGTHYLWLFLTCIGVFACAGPATRPVEPPGDVAKMGSGAEAGDMQITQRPEQGFEGETETSTPADLGEDPHLVQEGDLVRVNYTATLEDGTLIDSTLEDTKTGMVPMTLPGREERTRFSPEEILAGEGASIPGLTNAILGMAAGEKKTVTLAAEEAFGAWDSKKIVEFPCVKKQPRTVRMAPREYVNKFGEFPVLDKVVPYDPYLNARVAELTESSAVLELSGKDPEELVDDFGTTEVTTEGKDLILTLSPTVGAPFDAWNQTGKIVSAVGDTFTVDFNHPLAGEKVVLDVQMLSLAKASAFKAMEIPWMEDYDEAIAAAQLNNKPVFLVLYASWCGYCKKLFKGTMEDPRMKVLGDRFVWLKINSEKESRYKEAFGQKGFPMLVLMGSDGLVLEKINGYRDAPALREELDGFLKEVEEGASLST